MASLIQDPILQVRLHPCRSNLFAESRTGCLFKQPDAAGSVTWLAESNCNARFQCQRPQSRILHQKFTHVFAGFNLFEINSLPCQTLVVGLLQPSSKNIRFYWLDFITSCLPYIKGNLAQLLPHLMKCICSILQNDSNGNIYDSIAAKDILTLLRSMHMLLFHCQSEISSTPAQPQENPSPSTSSAATIVGAVGAPVKLFTDFVKDVFSQEGQVSLPTPNKDRQDGVEKELPLILQSLVKAWGPPASASSPGKTVVCYATQSIF